MRTAAIHTRRGHGLTVLLAVVAIGVLGPVVALGVSAWRTQDRTAPRNPAIALLVGDRIVAKPTSLLNVDVSMMRGAAGRSISGQEAAGLPPASRHALAPMSTTAATTSWIAGADSVGHVVEHFPRAGRLVLGDEDAAGLDALDNGYDLYHGTDAASASDIVANGIDRDAAARLGGGDQFWATTSRSDADIFAATNPAGEPPAVVGINVASGIDQAVANGILSPVASLPGAYAVNGWEAFDQIATYGLAG